MINNKIILGISIVAALFATACKTGKLPPSEAAPVEDAYFRNIKTTADTGNIADLEWRQYFSDTTLQNLIAKGIANNYDMQLALKKISASQATLNQAKLLQLPTLSFGVTSQSSTPSKNSLNGISLSSFLGQKHIEDYNAAFNLGWEADIWGKLRLKKDVALAQYLQSFEAQKVIQTQIVASIAEGYYNLLMLDAQLKITQSNLALTDTTLNITQLQWTAGLATNLAVQQATAQKQSVSVLIPQLQQNIALQENALSILIGEMPKNILRNRQLADISIPTSLNAGVPADLVSRRPDVRSQELNLRITNAQIGIAQAEMYPSLTISANGGLNSFKASNWFEMPASLFGNVLGGLTQPLFQRGTLKTNLKLAQNQREQSVLEFRQSVLNAVGEVSDALVQMDHLKDQSKITSEQLATLQSAIHNAQLLFKSGLANYLEVITAQGNALQAELNLASIKRQQLNASVALYRSLGGGWK
ncbi:efflux transporter outer membrane subunit [Rhizosphaericola mali]|uniref:Efflux transporter outer membrane subunit n=1 Tax=Rhizosphaericola mali TaxID=2545455 RepID=A0A5P2G5Y7_9BACT|nr:efflux transporter outer membrane subunit [Rhizosphaericola mali]QES90687.1 efflux transporter outer membrane subunit [Rhizosphaericola mali]